MVRIFETLPSEALDFYPETTFCGISEKVDSASAQFWWALNLRKRTDTHRFRFSFPAPKSLFDYLSTLPAFTFNAKAGSPTSVTVHHIPR